MYSSKYHTVKSLEENVKLLSKGLSCSEEARRVAETERDEFAAKIANILVPAKTKELEK